jgi:RNA 2',3'-cyclic 3'-phosphodiesterase
MTAQLSLVGFPEKPLSAERLYLAILPDITARTKIETVADKEIQDHRLAAKPVKPEHLHVTLCWIDDFPGGLPENIIARTKEAAARVLHPKLDVVFDRIASFRNGEDKPLVLLGGDGLDALKAFRLRSLQIPENLRSSVPGEAGLYPTCHPAPRQAQGGRTSGRTSEVDGL